MDRDDTRDDRLPAPMTRPGGPRALAELEEGETLASPADAPDTPSGVELGESALDLDRFEDRYARRALLGRGGMGEVHLARDQRVGRHVAVKTMLSEIGRLGEERFLREARVQAQLEHPAVVPVYDIGVGADGRAYFTMKRIAGRSLSSILSALAADDPETVAEYSRRRLLSAFLQVCFAVEYAHTRGVVHRDLKPGNVMIGAFGEVNVLDWGLAKIRGVSDRPEDGGPPPLELPGRSSDDATIAGAALGTPGYMAPEQASGDLDRIGPAADVYALGAILFELLFLERLHGQPHAMGRVTATVTGIDPPLRDRARADDVPPELLAVVERATQIEPEQRFASAREMATTIERYLEGERDERRRRELAEGHVEAANALSEDPSRRIDALRELGRALALDPAHSGALRGLERLLSSLPDEVPDEAREELVARSGVRRKSVLRASAVRSVAWLAAMPVVLAFGIIDWNRATIGIALLLGNAVVSVLIAARARAASERALLSVLVVSSLCIASFAFLLGPLVLVPGFAATNAMMFALSAGPRLRRAAISLSIASFAVPLGASVLGLDATYYAQGASPASIVITSPMAQMPLTGTLIFLLVAMAALMVTPTLLAGQLQDRLADAERRVFLQAFHLRQLLPQDGRDTER